MAIHTVVPEAELRRLAAEYPLGALRGYQGLEVGTVNTSYRLDLDAGRYFLRLYEEQPFEGAVREAEVLQWLGRTVPTPAPVPARDGAATRRVLGKPAALFPWVEGEILCQKRVTVDAAQAVGRTLARIHAAGHAPGAVLDGGRFGPLPLAERCARIRGSSDPDARALAGPLEEAARAFATRRRADLPSGLVHGDLFRDNVLWQKGDLVAVLDFESAHDGPFVYDLAVTLLSWTYGDAFDFALGRALCDGYRAERALAPAERAALFDEAVFATLRFTVTRITDEAIRIGKRWQRFAGRRAALEVLGADAFVARLGL